MFRKLMDGYFIGMDGKCYYQPDDGPAYEVHPDEAHAHEPELYLDADDILALKAEEIKDKLNTWALEDAYNSYSDLKDSLSELEAEMYRAGNFEAGAYLIEWMETVQTRMDAILTEMGITFGGDE